MLSVGFRGVGERMQQPERSLRILMALPDRRVRGGPPSHLYLLFDTLRELGVDVRGFVYGGRVHTETMVRKLGQRLADLVRLPFQIARVRPDMVHLNSAFDRHGLLRDVFFAPLCKLLGQRVVIKFHGSDEALASERAFPWRQMTRLLLHSCEVACVLSDEERRYFQREHPKGRYRVVKNALEFSRYTAPHDFRRKYGIPADRPLLLFIARFIEPKGIFDVIEALPAIRARHDVFTAFVGDGPVRQEAERRCAAWGLTQHVAFTGYIPEDETIGAYAESDLLVFPTYHPEGMPMVLFHSMASGLPIVTTRLRAAADWMEDGVHCVYVPPKNVAALVSATVGLLDSPSRRAAMGAAGKALVAQFDRRHVAREVAELYEDVLSGRHRQWEEQRVGVRRAPAGSGYA